MAVDPWLPIGASAGQAVVGRLLQSGPGWQIYADPRGGGRTLVFEPSLAALAIDAGLLADELLVDVAVGGKTFRGLSSGADYQLSRVDLMGSPNNLADALSFASAIRRTREALPAAPLAHGVFVEKQSMILPASGGSESDDETLLGRYLTGGIPISVRDRRRLATILTWLPSEKIDEICEAAGLVAANTDRLAGEAPGSLAKKTFKLPGRPDLERFFREHVIDIIDHAERYAALGIQFPSAVALYGPPGSGKTFAVDRLAEHLGWPRFEISSGTVGSPYIHETGRKIAEVFASAAGRAPSILVIDEMEAFLTDRGAGGTSGTHHVEEVAEFLRRIPEAVQEHVLVIGMTNRIDAIDPAILRRGRFDHIVEVGLANEAEVRALLDDLLAALPHGADVDTAILARSLARRPLSDVAYVLREAARLTVKSELAQINQGVLLEAIRQAPARDENEDVRPRIGFR